MQDLQVAHRFKNFLRRGRRKMHEVLGSDLAWPLKARRPSVHLGSEYGGWWVIPELVPPQPCVFSVGVGSDITFDLEMISRFNANIYAFDPTPKSKDWIAHQKLPPQFHFVPVGLANYDGFADFGLNRPDWDTYSVSLPAEQSVDRAHCPVARLTTLARDLHVSKIDILKVDIEGSEYSAIPDVLQSGFVFSQFLLELHYGPGHGATVSDARALLNLMDKAGYLLFERSPVGREFCFVHESHSASVIGVIARPETLSKENHPNP